MTLRFKDPDMAHRFVALCKSRKIKGLVTKKGKWLWVNVETDIETWRKLIRRWAEVSIEYVNE